MSSVLIIGANSGIGAACVATFLAKDWRVHATYHRASGRIASLAERSETRPLTISQLDVTSHESVESLASELACASATPLAALVFTASFSEPSLWNRPPLEIDPTILKRSFEVELYGLHSIMRALAPVLASNCSIVTFSSAGVRHGDSDTFAYNLAKSAVSTYTQMLARHYGSRFRINCIAPDSIATDWLNTWPISDAESTNLRVLRFGAKRIGRPDEVASCVHFLCSPEAGYLNGETITLDGGAG